MKIFLYILRPILSDICMCCINRFLDMIRRLLLKLIEHIIYYLLNH